MLSPHQTSDYQDNPSTYLVQDTLHNKSCSGKLYNISCSENIANHIISGKIAKHIMWGNIAQHILFSKIAQHILLRKHCTTHPVRETLQNKSWFLKCQFSFFQLQRFCATLMTVLPSRCFVVVMNHQGCDDHVSVIIIFFESKYFLLYAIIHPLQNKRPHLSNLV